MKFKLLSGGHCEMAWIEATPEDIANESSQLVKRKGKWFKFMQTKYEPGAILETDVDLVSLHGAKFQLMPDDTPCQSGPPLEERLNHLTIGELRTLAMEHDVPLNKSDVDRESITKTLVKGLA